MMLLDRDTLKNRFDGLKPKLDGAKPKAAAHCFAQREAIEMTCDEDQFNAELAQVMVSIAALTSALPATEAITDERVRRMMLALEGFSSPYLKTRFKQEATPAPQDNTKQKNKDIRIETRAPSRFRHASRRPTERAAAAITTKFLRVKEDAPAIEIMPLVPGVQVFAGAAAQLKVSAPRPQ
jgi:tellurite resistance protein